MNTQARLAGATSSLETLNRETRSFMAVANRHQEVDRHGTIFRYGSWTAKGRLDIFRKNPVGLWMHNVCENRPPIFSCQNIEENEKLGLTFWPTFQPQGEDPFADLIYNKYTARVPMLRAFSVGFFPWEEDDPTPDERSIGAELAFVESELHEISGVNVPSNRGSLSRDAKGMLSLDSSIVRAIESLGFVRQIRSVTDPSGKSQTAKLSASEAIETMDSMVECVTGVGKSALSQRELDSVASIYTRLSALVLADNHETLQAETEAQVSRCLDMLAKRRAADEAIIDSLSERLASLVS